MEIFDADGNLIGEIFEDTKEIVSSTVSSTCGWFEISFVLGLIGMAVHPIVGILIWILMFLLRVTVYIIKTIIRIIWWLIRVPFTYFVYRDWPEF